MLYEWKVPKKRSFVQFPATYLSPQLLSLLVHICQLCSINYPQLCLQFKFPLFTLSLSDHHPCKRVLYLIFRLLDL